MVTNVLGHVKEKSLIEFAQVFHGHNTRRLNAYKQRFLEKRDGFRSMRGIRGLKGVLVCC